MQSKCDEEGEVKKQQDAIDKENEAIE